MAKKASDDYIQLKKKITHHRTLAGIRSLAEELAKSEIDTCYHVISEAAARQNKKKLENSLYGGLK